MSSEVKIEDLLRQIVMNVVNDEDKVVVRRADCTQSVLLEVEVAKEDVGRAMGANGDIVRAIETLFLAVQGRTRKRIFVHLVRVVQQSQDRNRRRDRGRTRN
jgi:uncharacterized protein